MQKPLKILVVRFSSIGDIVLTTPVVRMLKKQLNAEIHFLTKSVYVSLFKNNPYIDSVYQIDVPGNGLYCPNGAYAELTGGVDKVTIFYG